MSDAVQAFTETYEANKHFLPDAKSVGKRQFPGVDVDRVDNAWRSEADDDEPERDDRQRDDDATATRMLSERCASCAAKNEIESPPGWEFVYGSPEVGGPDVRRIHFECEVCGQGNVVKHHRARRIQESAAHAFSRAYREGVSRPIQTDDPSETFALSYAGGSNATPVSAVQAVGAFFDAYRRRR
jgi:hypothetical protein